MNRQTLILASLFVLLPRIATPADEAHAFAADITADDFAAHVEVLASDAFGGREPGTEDETRSVEYLQAQFRRIGLAPGNGDSYIQPVPMQVRIGDLARSHAVVTARGKRIALEFGRDVMLGSDSGQAAVRIDDSAMVFAGYGIVAPEHGWDDYADADVTGKTVLLLAGEPDGQRDGSELFEGWRQTHYSRLTYKVEEAARHGAHAAIVIHDDRGAGYDWNGVMERWQSEFALRPEDRSPAPVAVQGWISGAAARALLAAAGMPLAELRDAADQAPFRARPLDVRFGATLAGRILRGASRNVIAKLSGSRRPEEAVVYCAHWDHLGTQRRKAKDAILNGALDNATGVAALLEIAERFATQPDKPERSIVFLVPTLEEQGLLGSAYYVRHPVIALARTVATINFDMLLPIGRTSDFVLIGLGYSELDAILEPIVARQGRTLVAEQRRSDSNHFLRSDHLSFARAGVPVLYMRGGVQPVRAGRGVVSGDNDGAWNDMASVYHTPDDEFSPRWDLRGVVEDMHVSYEVGQALASGREWPNYRSGNAYRALRDASRATISSD
jgi:Zn-dependent M28 family amino/carboxypeptidase